MKIKLSASFDDGSMYDLRMADLMYRHSIPTTFYIPVNYIKYLTAKGIPAIPRELLMTIAENFEIGSHGVNHELLTRVDEDTQDFEIAESKRELERIFNRRITKFCYPRGYYTTDIREKVRELYNEARTVRVGEITPADDPLERHTTVHVGLDRKEYGTDWLTYAKNKVDEAIDRAMKGEVTDYHFWGHSSEVEKNEAWDGLIDLLEYIDERRENFE